MKKTFDITYIVEDDIFGNKAISYTAVEKDTDKKREGCFSVSFRSGEYAKKVVHKIKPRGYKVYEYTIHQHEATKEVSVKAVYVK